MAIENEVTVVTGSRLHAGMFSFGQQDCPQFGGVGWMVRAPKLAIRVSRADEFTFDDIYAERLRATAERLLTCWNLAPPKCRVQVLNAPAQHVGLGSGTQLALALATALRCFLGLGPTDALSLAKETGRAERSSVGTFGFERGGLIVDSGKLPGNEATVVARVALPREWRWVLITPEAAPGLSGEAERTAFAQLPPVPREVTAELTRETLLHLVPAARAKCFAEFSRSLSRFGELAGSCFASAQGGSFAAPRLAELVAHIRRLGVSGVGQSSWGPTLFALLPSLAAAREFLQTFTASRPAHETFHLTIAATRNRPASVYVNR
jgi:beta-RFAP synthase